MLELEIDGKKVRAPEGSMIIEAAEIAGVHIPHFCYHKKLSLAANCRMCLVEVSKAKKAVPACATPILDGMKVFTHSETTLEAQKGVLEFLLINHPLDCPICDKGGECQLQDLAIGYGGSSSRFEETKRVVFKKEVGPLISMQEMSRCIHCTRCIRFGEEIAGVMELGMANRNMHSEVQTFVGRSVDSELSGNMIDLCPVGALTSKPFRYTARNWELAQRKSVSPHDSLGSNLSVQVKNNRVMRVLPRENEDINECWISDRDRFSYEGLNSPERLLKPMIRVDGALREVDWNVALDYVSHGLKDIVKTHGGEAVAALASPQSTLEEMYLLKKITRGLGSGNIDFRPRRRDFSTDSLRKGTPWSGMKLSEIARLDAVLVVGSFLRKDHPLFAQRLRQLAKRRGKISLLSVTTDDPLVKLHAQISVSPSELPRILAAVLKSVAEIKNVAPPSGLESVELCADSRKIAQSLVDGKRTAIFLGSVAEQLAEAGQIHALATELGQLTGAVVGFLFEGANSVGGYVAQALPTGLNAYEMFAQPRQAYVLLGVEPDLDCHNPAMAVAALKQAALVVMVTPFKHEAALEYADVLLPSAPFAETSGTFVNLEGRVQSFGGVCRPQGEARPGWKILRVLGNLLDISGFGQDSSEQVRDEVIPVGAGFVNGLDNGLSSLEISLQSKETGLQRVAEVPIYFSDLLVRRAAALQKTHDAAVPSARMNQVSLAQLGVSAGDTVRVRQGQGDAVLTVAIDETVPDNCVRVAAAHASTAALGDMFGTINVERA